LIGAEWNHSSSKAVSGSLAPDSYRPGSVSAPEGMGQQETPALQKTYIGEPSPISVTSMTDPSKEPGHFDD